MSSEQCQDFIPKLCRDGVGRTETCTSSYMAFSRAPLLVQGQSLAPCLSFSCSPRSSSSHVFAAGCLIHNPSRSPLVKTPQSQSLLRTFTMSSLFSYFSFCSWGDSVLELFAFHIPLWIPHKSIDENAELAFLAWSMAFLRIALKRITWDTLARQFCLKISRVQYEFGVPGFHSCQSYLVDWYFSHLKVNPIPQKRITTY